jgi:beta-glucosidase
MLHEGGESPTVSVTVTNTGTCPSREVVQVYLRPADPAQPVRLVGWRVANAGPGESVTVEVETDARLWRRWDAAAHRWDTLPRGGQFIVARGLGDVQAVVELGAT